MANIVAGTPAKKLEKIEQGIAIVANGNTHAAITTGQYVYVKGHSTLAEGMYTATAAIAENATLSSSNLTAASGGLNTIKASVDSVNSNLEKYSTTRVFSNAFESLADFQSQCDSILDSLPEGLSLYPIGHMYQGTAPSVGLENGGAVFAINRNSSWRTICIINTVAPSNTILSITRKLNGTWDTTWRSVVSASL